MSLRDVVLYYFDIPNIPETSLRGENIKLLLVDADIAHTYKKVEFQDWNNLKSNWERSGNIFTTLPTVEIDGKLYGNVAPIMRHLSKQLGKYIGSGYEDEQRLDTYSDSLNDWYENMKKQYFKGQAKDQQEHFNDVTQKYLARFNTLYGQTTGSYILGDQISYVDFLTYHLIDDEKALQKLGEFTHLKAFVEEFEKRPNIKKYLASLTDAQRP